MKSPKFLLTLSALAVGISLLTASGAAAQMIAIPNGDFSMTGVPAPDFTTTGQGGIYTAGTLDLYGNNDGQADQVASGTLTTIALDTTYTFSLNIATSNPADGNFYYTQNGRGNMALLANGTAISGATLSNIAAPGLPTYTTYTVSFNTLVGSPNRSLVGQNLSVQFGLDAFYAAGLSGGGYPNVFFQNATLDGTAATLVPEPCTWAAIVCGLGILGVVRRRRSVC